MKKIKIMRFNRGHFRDEAIVNDGTRILQGPFRDAIPHPNIFFKQLITGLKIPFGKKK